MDFAVARRNMVESQIRANRVTDGALIGALSSLPREAFLPKAMEGVAYMDEATPLGDGRFLTEPLVLARLIQIAAVKADDMVLVVGGATGYGAAVLARMAGHVVAVECSPPLAAGARTVLRDLGVETVEVVDGPLDQGHAAGGPYDVIVFDGAVGDIPEAVIGQLAEGGRLVAVVVDGPVGRGTLVERRGGTVSRRAVFDAGTPILPDLVPKSGFVF